MTNRRKILLLLPGVLLGAVLAVALWPSAEPSFRGKTLGEWLIVDSRQDRASGSMDQAENAIRHIGTNGIPYYLDWIKYEMPPWKIKLRDFYERIAERRIPDSLVKKEYYAELAPNGFRILGPEAKVALPDLARIVNNSNATNTVVMERALHAMTDIGPDALPFFMTLLTNKNENIRFFTPYFIQTFGTNALPAVPALLRALKDEAEGPRASAANALQIIDPEALKRATQK